MVKKITVKVNGDKPWFKSKTLWVNVLAIIGGIATAISGELKAGGMLTLFGVVNTVLRVVTKSQIKFR